MTAIGVGKLMYSDLGALIFKFCISAAATDPGVSEKNGEIEMIYYMKLDST